MHIHCYSGSIDIYMGEVAATDASGRPEFDGQ